MKTRLLVFSTAILFMASVSVRATYSYFYTENLASPVWSNWTLGTIYGNSLTSGYYSAGGYGGLVGSGSMLYSTPHSGGGEVSFTLRIAGPNNWDTFAAFLASADPGLVDGVYDFVSVVPGTISIGQWGQNFGGTLGSVYYAPHDGDVIRAVAVPGSSGT